MLTFCNLYVIIFSRSERGFHTFTENTTLLSREGEKMSVEKQAQNRGFKIVGRLCRYEDPVQSKRIICYMDEAGNEYIMYRGVLTIISANGEVF